MPCTTLLVGKNASYDGSTLIARMMIHSLQDLHQRNLQ